MSFERSDALGQVSSQTPFGWECSVVSRVDWQKHETYIDWDVFGAAGGTQPSWACLRRGQDKAQAGKLSEAEDGRRVTLWAETMGRRVDVITAMAAAVHDQRAMAKYGRARNRARSERASDHVGGVPARKRET